MFTVNIQSTTKSGITLSMSFSAKDEKELKSKVQETVAIVQPTEAQDPRQLQLVPLTGGTQPAKTDTKIDEVLATGAAVVTQVKESSMEGTAVSDLDKDGRVWDERIDSPLKVKDRWGRWKAKGGVDKTTRIRIIEELKAGIKPEPTPAPAQQPVQAVETTQETNQVEAPVSTASEVVHMTLEHFGNNFPTVMSDLFNSGKITAEKTQQLCEIARVKQAWEIPLNETSLKAVYMNLVQGNLV